MQLNNWYLIPKPCANPVMRLICFPYAGGSASSYLNWSSWLPSEIELVAIQPPGRTTRISETPFCNLRELVAELVKSFSVVTTAPFVFFGHSLGARLAFELMVQCEKAGLRLPQHFIASGSRGPQIPLREPSTHSLTDEEFIKELKNLDGAGASIYENSELMELCLPLLRADFKASDTYLFEDSHTFNCRLSTLGGTEDNDVTKADLDSWGKFYSDYINSYLVKGDHFFVDKNEATVKEYISKIIENELRIL